MGFPWSKTFNEIAYNLANFNDTFQYTGLIKWIFRYENRIFLSTFVKLGFIANKEKIMLNYCEAPESIGFSS